MNGEDDLDRMLEQIFQVGDMDKIFLSELCGECFNIAYPGLAPEGSYMRRSLRSLGGVCKECEKKIHILDNIKDGGESE